MRTNKIVKLSCALILLMISVLQAQHLSTDSLRCWLSYIASEEMKGRPNGSKEIEEVASWLSVKFQQYGVIPLDSLESLFQEYPARNQGAVYKNVIGYMPGKKNHSHIILSAHFDHVGVNRRGEFNEDKQWQLTEVLGGIGNNLHRMSDNYSFVRFINNKTTCLPAHTIGTNTGLWYIHSERDKIEFIDFENLHSFIDHITDFVTYISLHDIKFECFHE